MFYKRAYFYRFLGVGFAIGVLSHLLKVDDALIGVISCLSKVLSGFVFALAPTKTVFYIGKRLWFDSLRLFVLLTALHDPLPVTILSTLISQTSVISNQFFYYHIIIKCSFAVPHNMFKNLFLSLFLYFLLYILCIKYILKNRHTYTYTHTHMYIRVTNIQYFKWKK